MKTKIEVINKERAAHYLTLNRNNRPINTKRVIQYVTEMKSGKWKEGTGEGLKISKEGFLIDGQHRLTAIVAADVSIQMLVVYDLEQDIFDVLDTGRNRGANDVFALKDIPSSNRIVSVLKEYRAFKMGKFYKITALDNNANTNAALLEAYFLTPEKYQENSRAAGRYYASFNGLLSATNIGSFLLLFSEKNPAAAEDFFDQLCGKTLTVSPAIESLKSFLLKDKLALRKSSTKLKYAVIIKAWNFYRLGKTVKYLKFAEDQEDFPTII